MTDELRSGPIGALIDEYERSVHTLVLLVEDMTDEEFIRLADLDATDPDCRSGQTVLRHVIRSGYGYADLLRAVFGISSASPDVDLPARADVAARLDDMMAYTIATFDGRWEITDEEVLASSILTRWGQTYDIEQLLEHAIVHVLRHRRQTIKFLRTFGREVTYR